MTNPRYRVKPLTEEDTVEEWPVRSIYVEAITPETYSAFVGRIGEYAGSMCRADTGETLQIDLSFDKHRLSLKTYSFAPWMLEAIEDEYALP